MDFIKACMTWKEICEEQHYCDHNCPIYELCIRHNMPCYTDPDDNIEFDNKLEAEYVKRH